MFRTIAPNKIILHHSLTKDSGTVSASAIRKYHIETLGWADTGYHYLLEDINGRHEILFGRMSDTGGVPIGAHTKGQNDSSIGICFVGNYDVDEVHPDMWNLGIKLVRLLMVQYHIQAKDIYGHNKFAQKSCPGEKFNVDAFRINVMEKS